MFRTVRASAIDPNMQDRPPSLLSPRIHRIAVDEGTDRPGYRQKARYRGWKRLALLPQQQGDRR
jgi:hypothetical protein